MAAIKVHGSPISTATQRVLVALTEKDFEFELINVDMKTGEHKKEPFLSINPFGQLPGYQEGDLKLFESRAITQHIAHSNPDKGTELLCKGQAMSILGVWIEVEGHQFDPVASKLCWELGFKPLFGMTADAATVEEQEAKLGQVLDVYEKRLSESKYLACGCFTLADLHHLPTLQILMATQSKKLFDARPHVSAWAADILARPAWAKVMDLKKH